MPVLGSVGAEKRPVQSMPSRTLNLEETGTVMIVRHPSKVLRGYGGGGWGREQHTKPDHISEVLWLYFHLRFSTLPG